MQSFEFMLIDLRKNVANVVEDDEEDWDKEMEGVDLKSYDPMKKVLDMNLPINTKCMGKRDGREVRSLQRLGDRQELEDCFSVGQKKKKKKKKNCVKPVGM